MAFIIKDRIKEGTTTTGTGDITLGGAPATFEAFQSYMTNGDTTYYAIVHTASGVDEWEVGLGTWNTGNTLTRTTVLAGSSGTSAVNFGSGTKDIFMTYPAAHAALAEDDVTFDNITVTGTVDGRDVAADGTKLDTVEQNADVTDAVNVAAAGALMKSGGTMTGNLILNADPTTALGAATKEYVDTIAAAGIHYHTPVRVEAPSALTATYDNGTSGVGATLTNSGTQAALVIDGVTLSTSDRVLVYNQTNAAHNGVYTVTNIGSASTNWVLTRATDADSYGVSDPDAFGEGDAFFVKEGDTGAGELYVMNTSGTITFGTTAINFTVIAETAVYSAGTGMSLSGTTFSIGQDVGTTANVTFNQVTAAIIGNVTGNVTGDVSGNAGTATKLATARTVQLSGDVTGSASFDGSANINITAAVTDDSHAHVISNVDGLQTALDGKVPTSRTITAGNGLTGGGNLTANRTLNVGAGTGISVSADAVAHGDTSTLSGTYGSTSNATKIDNITVDEFGHITAITTGGTGSMTSWNVQANGGTQVAVTNGEEVNFINGNATTVEVTNQDNPTVKVNHADTSSQASVNNSNGTVIQDITLDGYGHITGLASVNLDGRYYTETEADSRFLRADADDSFSGNLTSANNGWIKFYANEETDENDGKIGSGVFSSGLNIVGAQTTSGTGRQVRIWGTLLSSSSEQYFHDGYHPNADKWTTARSHTVTLTGDVTGTATQSVDGTGNKTWSISTAVGDNSHIHEWINSDSPSDGPDNALQYLNTNGITSDSPTTDWYNTIRMGHGDPNTYYNNTLAMAMTGSNVGALYGRTRTNGTAGSWNRFFADNYHPNADKWTTARTHTVTLTGDVTGSASQSVDGTGNKTWSITTAVGDDSHSHSQVFIPDTRGASRPPSYYPDRYTSFDFQQNTDTGAGGDGWTVLQTVSPWSTYNDAHRQQQIAFTGSGGLKFRYATSDSAWASWQTLWTSGNDGSNSGLDADLLDGNHASAFATLSGATFTGRVYINSAFNDKLILRGSADPSIELQNASNAFRGRLGVSNTGKEIRVVGQDPDNTNAIHILGIGQNGLRYSTNNGGAWNKVWHASNDGSGSGLDADLLDGVQGSSFLRSDAADTASGDITFTGGAGAISVGAGSDLRFTTGNWTGEHAGKIQYHSNHFYFQGSSQWIFRTAAGANNAYIENNGRIQSVTDIRAPIFYDRNDTSYYTDPNSTSSMYQIHVWNDVEFRNKGQGITGTYDSYALQGVFNMGDAYKLASDGSTAGNLYGIAWSHSNAGTKGGANNLASHGMLILENGAFKGAWGGGSLRTPSDVRAPIFYDYNNTSYYADPAGNSRTNTEQTNYLGLGTAANTSGGYRLNMGGSIDMNNGTIDYVHQLHFNDNVRFYDDGNDNYLNFKWGDTGAGGIRFRDGDNTLHGTIYGDGAGRFGLLDQDGNWAVQVGLGTEPLQLRCNNNIEFYVYDSYTYSPGSSRAPIFYDYNNTNYYVDPASTSKFNDIYLEGEIYHNGDTNTYIQFHAADQWRVVVGGTERLEVKNSSPHVLVTGDLNSTSDARLKENVEPIANALSDVTQLEGVSFDWKDTGTRGHGFIAQQVEPILPDVVNTNDETGIKSINYVGMIGHLVEAIKELKAEIDELKR